MTWRSSPKLDTAGIHRRVTGAPALREAGEGAPLVRVTGRAQLLRSAVVAPVSKREVIGYSFSGAFYDPDSGQEAPFSLIDLTDFQIVVGNTTVEVRGAFPLVLRKDLSEADVEGKSLAVAGELLAWLRGRRRTGSARLMPRVRWREGRIDVGEVVSVWGTPKYDGATGGAGGYRDVAFRTVVVPPADGTGLISDVSPNALVAALKHELMTG